MAAYWPAISLRARMATSSAWPRQARTSPATPSWAGPPRPPGPPPRADPQDEAAAGEVLDRRCGHRRGHRAARAHGHHAGTQADPRARQGKARERREGLAPRDLRNEHGFVPGLFGG